MYIFFLTLLQIICYLYLDSIGKVTALFKSADRDNSGFVDKNELKQICHSCNSKMTDADIDEILRQADKSGDDLISLQEFLNACT